MKVSSCYLIMIIALVAVGCCTKKCCEKKYPCNDRHQSVQLCTVSSMSGDLYNALKIGTDEVITDIPKGNQQYDLGDKIMVTLQGPTNIPIESRFWCKPIDGHCYKPGHSQHTKLHYKHPASVNVKEEKRNFFDTTYTLAVTDSDTIWVQSEFLPKEERDIWVHYLESDDANYYLDGYKVVLDFSKSEHQH